MYLFKKEKMFSSFSFFSWDVHRLCLTSGPQTFGSDGGLYRVLVPQEVGVSLHSCRLRALQLPQVGSAEMRRAGRQSQSHDDRSENEGLTEGSDFPSSLALDTENRKYEAL